MTEAGALPRAIRHPGPVQPARLLVQPCTAVPVALTLQPGRAFGTAVAEAFAAAGFAGGYLRLRDAPMARLDYVIPARAPDDGHAAWYSATRRAGPGARILDAGLHLGLRDGAPFLHCHGLWTDAGGGVRMGHLLPSDAALAAPHRATGWGLRGAVLDVADDAETRFRLFAPRGEGAPAEHGGDGPRDGAAKALLMVLRPNQDVTRAIEAACAAGGLQDARIEGIGSLVGAEQAGGDGTASFATEVLLCDGWLRDGRCTLDAAVVGLEGEISEGGLVAGRNPVCVTFELLAIGA